MELTPTQFAEVRESLTTLASEGRSAEKRRFSRMKVQARIVLANQTTGQTYTAMTRDLSQSGMGIVQSVDAHKGHKLLATLPRSETSAVDVVCQVVDARPLADGLTSVHLEFQSVPEPRLIPRPDEES